MLERIEKQNHFIFIYHHHSVIIISSYICVIKLKKQELFKLLIDNDIDVSGRDNRGRDVWSYIQFDCWGKDKLEMEQILLAKHLLMRRDSFRFFQNKYKQEETSVPCPLEMDMVQDTKFCKLHLPSVT